MRKMFRYKLIVAMSAPLFLIGCDTFNDTIHKISVEPAVQAGGSEALPPVNLDLFPYTSDEVKNDPRNNIPYFRHPDPDAKMRNALQDAILARSEYSCSNFRKSLFARHVVRKLGFQTVALGLTAAATAISGEAAKTALSAAGVGVLGLDESIDAHALQRNAITAILNTINSERQRMLEDIQKKQKSTKEDYSVYSAVGDAIRYNQVCSLTEALSVLGTAVEKKNANEKMINELNVTIAEMKLNDAVRARAALPNGSPADVVAQAQKRVDRADEVLKNLLGTQQ